LFTAVALGFGGLVGTFAGGAASDHYHERLEGGRIVLVVWSAIACAVLFMVSFAVDFIPLRLGLQIVGVAAAAGAAPGLRAAMTDVVPPESRGVGASAMALATSVFGLALAPFLVGLLSDLTGSLVTAFYIVFPPVIVGLLFLLRARHTLADDAQAIVTAIVEENQLLEQQRLATQDPTPDTAPDDTPDPNRST
jgi:MFS family permease